MENACKKTEEGLAELYRNAQLALQSIADILPAVENEKVREELSRQYEAYEHFSAKATTLARDKGVELKEPSAVKKMMMWGSIKMSTMTDDSVSHIAEMMTQGTVMGITALRATAADMPEGGNEEILALFDEMIKAEEEFEKIWKGYL